MIYETNISDYYKVIQSSDECSYKYILGKLKDASEVYIMTFGNTKENRSLVKSLANINAKIKMISDIESDYTVKPEELYNNVNGGFNFDKNTKIIMTEKAVFIGTENDNLNCGFLTIDLDVVDQIRENLFRKSDGNTKKYIGFEFTRLQITCMNYYSRVNRILEDIIKGAFKEDEKGNGYYNIVSAQINFNDLEWIKNTVDEFISTIKNVKEDGLRDNLDEAFDKENLQKLKVLCDNDEAMKKLSNLNSSTEEKREVLAAEAEKEICSLYEKLSVFQEELYGIVEVMIDAKTKQ